MSVRIACIAGLAIGPVCFFAAAEGTPALQGSAATAYLKQEGIYNSLGEAVQAAMYGAKRDGLGFAAPNPAQDFVARFSNTGLTIEGIGWKSSWRLRSVGYGERQVAVGPALLDAGGTRVELRRGAGVTEWYVNGGRGLEQGFTLERPSRARQTGERLLLTMDIVGDLKAREANGGVDLVRADGTVGLRYEHLVVTDAKGRGLAARTGVADGAVWVEVEDAGATWPVTVDRTFTQQGLLKAFNPDPGDLFGWSVAVSGDTAVIGAIDEDSNATGVNGNQADNSAKGSGAAYVFVRNGITWSQQAYLKASNTGASDIFGASVAVSGNTLVVGALGEGSSAKGVNGNQADNGAGNSGAAYIFVRNGVTWFQQAYLKASNTEAGDQFGGSVAVSGDTVVVGAWAERSNATGVNGDQSNNSAMDAGAAYVFVRNADTWSQQAYLKASNTGAGVFFGHAVAVSGDTVVIGAYSESSGAIGSGAAYVFVRNGVTWSQQAYLKASNPGDTDYFGYSVAVSGDTVVVGALKEDSSTRGVNGDQTNNNAEDAGAAYIFVRDGVTWSQQAYLKASNTGADDHFGTVVAISGDTVVVGAPQEDSGATGVNGDQGDNSIVDSGAAYVFIRNGVTWSQQAYLKPSDTGTFASFGNALAVSGPTVTIGSASIPNVATTSGAAYTFFDPSVRITDVRSITDFGGAPNFTSGSWLQIKGVNLAETTRIWQTRDFNGNNAPVNLDNVSVLFNGKFGFMYFTKPDDEFGPSQINVQAPADLGDGPVNIQVLNHFAVSNTFVVQKTALAPGMFSPPKFNVGGKQYLVATYGSDYFFVGNENLLPGAPFRPAKPGDILYLYGVGFGDVTVNIPPGVIPTVLTQLNAQVQFQFGPALVTPYYAGYYPNFIGLDLFGLVVPDVPDGDHQITVLVNGQRLAQTLYLTVKR